MSIPAIPRRWVRKKGTKIIFQMTPAFIERLGHDMVEVPEALAMKIREEGERENKHRAQANKQAKVEELYQAAKAANPEIGDVEAAPPAEEAPAPAAAAPEEKPESPEEAMARLEAEDGASGAITDGLDDMTGKELDAEIDKINEGIEDEEAKLSKNGKKSVRVAAIRAARG
jgi:hypothetical protein